MLITFGIVKEIMLLYYNQLKTNKMKTVKKINKMKKITSLMATCVILLLVLSSCSSDNASSTSNDSILGKWDLDKIGFIISGTTIPDQDYLSNQPGCNKNYLKFKNDGFMTSGQYNSECSVFEEDAAWSQTNNTFSIDPTAASESGIPDTWEIISVSTTDLEIKGDMTGMPDVDPGVVAFMILKLKKSAVQN